MAQGVTLIKVLVASPGDVKAERDALKAIVDQVNHTSGLQRNLLFFVLRWEDDVHPGFGEDAQDVVNKQIDFSCIDLFVGILWKRFGTPTKRAASGTEEEFNQCFELWQKRKQPELMFYFNGMPFAPANRAEHKEYGKVLKFKERLAEAGGLKGDYQGIEDFKDKIRKDLTLFAHRFEVAGSESTRFTFPVGNHARTGMARTYRLGSTFSKTITLREHRFPVDSLAFSPDDRLLASGDRSGTILLWDIEKVEKKVKGLLKTFLGHQGGLDYLAFSTDGRGLVSGSNDYELRIWDVEREPTEANRVSIRGFSKSHNAFAPDSRLIATQRDGQFCLKDSITWADEAKWPGHKSKAETWTFSPDGSRLASAHTDGAVILWDVSKQRLERLLRESGDLLLALAFSPDGTLLAACGREATVRVWDVRSGKQVAELPHAIDRVRCLTFNHSGRYLVSGDFDGLVILWKRTQ